MFSCARATTLRRRRSGAIPELRFRDAIERRLSATTFGWAADSRPARAAGARTTMSSWKSLVSNLKRHTRLRRRQESDELSGLPPCVRVSGKGEAFDGSDMGI